jgi:hypothetical protein
MRILWVAALILLTWSESFGASAMLVRRSVGGGGACTETPAISGANYVEGFMGAGYENATCGTAPCIAETVGTGGTLDEDYDISAMSPPTYSCTQGLRTAVTTDGTATFTRFLFAGTKIDPAETSVDIYADVYIDSYTLPANSDEVYILNGMDGFSTGPFNVRLWMTSGIGLSLKAYSTAGESAAIAVSVDTWYRIKVRLDAATAANSYIDIDSWNGSSFTDVAQEAFTRGTALLDTLRIGSPALLDADEAIDIKWGVIWVDTL